MTIVTFASVKGAPGVTTLTCLVGATWPNARRVMVVEGDPSGGDLAARFQLSAREGWLSFNAAARRGDTTTALEPHLQHLPGGLEVLVGAKGMERAEVPGSVVAFLESVAASPGGPPDVLVDLGRLLPGERSVPAWIERSDSVVICTGGDAASAFHIREKVPAIVTGCRGRVGLAVAGKGEYSRSDFEQFTGIPVFGGYPFDETSAGLVTGRGRAGRKLGRSPLVAASGRLAMTLARGPISTPEAESARRWERISADDGNGEGVRH